MSIVKTVWPTKFLYVRHRLPKLGLRILDIGCGNNSPSITKHWFPNCYYAGADIQQYNNGADDLRAMDAFYLLDVNGGGYAAIPDASFDLVVLHHVIEHMKDPMSILPDICSKVKPGGYIWVAFPSLRSLSFPPAAEGTLQFCDDDTHVYVPGIRETSNVLLANGMNVVHAGRTRDLVRMTIGAMVLPLALLRRLLTGKLVVRGLWYILGFEDHVLGQRWARGDAVSNSGKTEHRNRVAATEASERDPQRTV